MKKKTLLGVAAAAAVGAEGWYLAAGGRKNQIEHIRREAKRLLAVRRDELAALRRLSQRMLERINRNYSSILTINTSLLALGIFGILPPTTTALLHNARSEERRVGKECRSRW